MAYMATFSSGAIVISQLIRQYSVHLFFLTVTLWFFILYFGKREKRYLYGYSLFMALSISTLYATVIPLSAIIIVWLGHSVIQKKPAREFANIIIFNLPPFIIFGIFYIYHISTWTGEERFQSLISQKYYGVLFPQTLSGFIENTCGLFRYLFFLSPYSTLLMVLAGAGLVLLWRSFRRSLAVIIFITFLINCALAYFKKYPLGESRHSIYLFPMVAVLGGAAIQSGLNYFTKNVIPFLAKILSLRSEYLQIPLLYLGITGILVSTLVITFSYRQSDFLRRYAYDALGNEFPQKRVNHQRVFNYLTEHVKPNDFILTNFRTSYYFRYDLLPNQPHYIFESWYSSKMKWRGFDCLYIHTYGFDKINTVIGPLEGLHKHGDLKNVSKVWLVNIEWVGDEIEILLSNFPEYRFLFTRELAVEGGRIYSLKPEDIRQIGLQGYNRSYYEQMLVNMPLKDISYKTDKINFGTAQGFPFLRSGWSFNETSQKEKLSYIWALGKSASIFLSLPPQKTKLIANVRSPFAGSQQVVTVKVDGKEVGTWKNSKQWVWERHNIVIGRNKDRQDVSVVEFIFSKYVEQTEKEKRALALLFESIILE